MKGRRHSLAMTSTGSIAVICASVLLASCSAPPAAPPPAAAGQPPAAPAVTLNTSYNELMVTWIDNASHVLWDVEKPGFAPKDEGDWIELEDHAMQVSAAGTLIQLTGAGPKDAMWVAENGWKTNAQAMSDAGRSALVAAKARDLPALVEANGKLVLACIGCHKQFKPELPSEGIVHQRPHSETHEKD